MVRLRIKYEKVGAIQYASHRDTIRLLRRGLAIGELPVCFSRGFNPHPRLSFGPSLRTGWVGLGECLDVFLSERVPDFEDRCNPGLPEGLHILETAEVDAAVPTLSNDVTAARYGVFVDRRNPARPDDATWKTLVGPGAGRHGNSADDSGAVRLPALEAATRERVLVEGGDAGKTRRPRLLELEIFEKTDGIELEYMSTMHQGQSVFPEALVGPMWGDPQALEYPIKAVRRALYVERNGSFVSPVSKGAVQTQS
jgi:hypothetical protein